jgi:hypothetical protein
MAQFGASRALNLGFDADLAPAFDFESGFPKMMRIHADMDPQHC